MSSDARLSHNADTEFPIVDELPAGCEAEQAFLRFAALPYCVFLDSARRDPQLGRHSFLAADPFEVLTLPADGSDAFRPLVERLDRYRAVTHPELPPFQGGAAGVWGYELNRSLEQIPKAEHDEFQFPALVIGLYDLVLALDHITNRAWVISQGFPELEPAARRRRARERIAQARGWLTGPAAERPWGSAGEQRPIDIQELAPHWRVPGATELTSNVSREAYLGMIARAVEYIRAGDIFQVNLAQRLLHASTDSSLALYLRLRRRNPAPFAGYFDAGPFQILSASPERFLKSSAGEVETRPIKGTRQRTRRPEADLFAGDELELSEKDRAENVMIVDLLRNDLSRVCLPDSVQVTQLCRLETYEYVQHLVSAVRGTLRPGCGPLDLLRAAFPGGSITGAPKVRAMEVIAELEPAARGAYCGALGYVGFDGALDTNLLIRTITAGRGWWQMPVGGGIVAQSHPEREYEETWHKAAGLLRSLR